MSRAFSFITILCALAVFASTFLMYDSMTFSVPIAASSAGAIQSQESIPEKQLNEGREIFPEEAATTTKEVSSEATEMQVSETHPNPRDTIATTPREPTDEKTPLVHEATNLAETLHTLSNITRDQYGVTPLNFDTTLAVLAEARSQDMLVHNYFSHTSLGGCDLKCRFTKSGYITLSWGENLAESTDFKRMSQRELSELFIKKWLQSNSHRDNLLSSTFTHQGIGIAENNDRIVVTILFAAP